MKRKYFGLLGLLCAAAVWARAETYTPMFARHRLIAGAGETGYKDGNFVSAIFNAPTGLAVSPDGTQVYVADSGNHSIRRILLTQLNRVETVVGDGIEGDLDGHGVEIPNRLVLPTDIAVTANNDRLYIYDRGSQKIKMWDLQKKELSTVFRLTPTAERMVAPIGLLLSAKERHLVFIDSAAGALCVGSIKTGTLIRLCKDPLLSEAGVNLAFSGNRLRLLSPGKQTLYSFSTNGKELDRSGFEALTAGASATLQIVQGVHPGLQGFAGMGMDPKHQGVISWDQPFACFRLYENVTAQFLGMSLAAELAVPAQTANSVIPFFSGPLGLAYDSAHSMIYISEKRFNRVVAVRDDSQVLLKHPLWFNHDYPKTKPVGVTRILMFGCSRSFHSGEEPEDINRYLSTLMETHINAMSALNGTGKQYEIIHAFYRGRVIGAGEVFLLEHPEIIRDYKPDYVIFPMDVESLWWDVSSWNVVETKDDVPIRTEDLEWAAKSMKEKVSAMGPLTNEMVSYCKHNPKSCADRINISVEGIPEFVFTQGTPATFFSEPMLKKLSLQVESKLAKKISSFCKKENVKPVVFILPTKEFMGGGDNDKASITFNGEIGDAHAATLLAQGIPAFNLTLPMRVIDTQLFPLWSAHDGHYRNSGIDWVAYLMASKFLKEFGSN